MRSPASGSALAIRMSLDDRAGPLSRPSGSPTALRPRVCVFLHGLACDEQSWRLRTDAWATSPWADALPAGKAPQYGALLEHEPGVSALWLRYNSGLAIDDNAQQLADLIEALSQAAPQVDEWLLIGHSMGGLITRRAQALAVAAGLGWARRVPTIVCLGSPHQGAPLEKLGAVAAVALALSDVTRPLARIADARSRGIKDLRRGPKGAASTAASPVPPPALWLVFATVSDVAEPGSRGSLGAFVGSVFGDGLVRAGSAADDGAQGNVQRVELAGLGHMSLLNHPRVYAVIRLWLNDGPSTTGYVGRSPYGRSEQCTSGHACRLTARSFLVPGVISALAESFGSDGAAIFRPFQAAAPHNRRTHA